MEVRLNNISKRFGYQWIVRNCNYSFPSLSIIGISGPNGSGKSTLIKIISSHLSPTQGTIDYTLNEKAISRNDVYKQISLVGPYTGVINEFTLNEIYSFHFKFKNKFKDHTYSRFRDWMELEIDESKKIRDYSSGMHQRLQLALALMTDCPLMLLDEPTSFLDEEAKKWFFASIKQIRHHRTVIIASNSAEDFSLCDKIYDLRD